MLFFSRHLYDLFMLMDVLFFKKSHEQNKKIEMTMSNSKTNKQRPGNKLLCHAH